MSAASELREALKDLKYPLSQGGVIVRQWQSDEVVDAILDAVIAALSEEANEKKLYQYGEGWNDAVDRIRVTLQSAKTQKGEE